MNAFAADSHPGHKRSHNEDCFLTDDALGLFLVADGVGGHADGEVASAIVRDTLRKDINAGASLLDAIQHAHREVLAEIDRRQDSNMGSTVVAARLSDSEYDIAWVGDSRAYSFDGTLKQLSRDHNPVSEMLARGALTPEQAAAHPERNMLSQSLGVSENIEVAPGRICGDLHAGQQLILCSDGLTDEVSDDHIEQIMTQQQSPGAQVAALIQAALDNGGRDNVTVVVVGAKGPPGEKAVGAANNRHKTLNNLPAVMQEQHPARSHDRKVMLILGLMAALAAAWVALKVL